MEKPREPLQGIRRSHDPFITNGPRFMEAASRLIFRERSPAANFTPLSRDKPRICARFNLTPFLSLPPSSLWADDSRSGETIGRGGEKKESKTREGRRRCAQYIIACQLIDVIPFPDKLDRSTKLDYERIFKRRFWLTRRLIDFPLSYRIRESSKIRF